VGARTQTERHTRAEVRGPCQEGRKGRGQLSFKPCGRGFAVQDAMAQQSWRQRGKRRKGKGRGRAQQLCLGGGERRTGWGRRACAWNDVRGDVKGQRVGAPQSQRSEGARVGRQQGGRRKKGGEGAL